MDIVEKEIKIDNTIVELTDKIRQLTPEFKTIEKLCELYDKFLYSVKQVHFEYYVFDDNFRNDVCVVYMDNRMKMKKSLDFIDTIADFLLDSVITWDNLEIARRHLDLIVEIFGNEFIDIRNDCTSIVLFNKHNIEYCIVSGKEKISSEKIIGSIKRCIEDYDNISLGEILYKLDISPLYGKTTLQDMIKHEKYIIIDPNKFIENNCNDVGNGKFDVFVEDPNFDDLLIFTNIE